MKELLFKDWESIYHVAICAVLSYFTLFLFIRISGKRTLAKLTAFDFVVTVTLGSTLSSMILGKSTLTEGSAALLMIIVLQYALAYAAKNSKKLEKVINSKPIMLYYNGAFLEDALQREVITREEVHAAVREFRLYRMEDVKAVVMEINGELTVIADTPKATNHHSLSDVEILNSKEGE